MSTLSKFFHFSRSERLGAMLLSFACALTFITPEILAWWDGNLFYEEASAPPLLPLASAENTQAQQNLAEAAPAALFHFDPNLADAATFERLGLSARLARTILKYREKGGKFRSAEDFQKIWGLEKSDYERLAPFIDIPEKAGHFADKNTEKQAELFNFDPNLASEEELLRLGIPEKAVQTMLKYREKGGRFRAAEDLKKLYSLRAEDAERLAPFVQISAANPPAPAMYQGGGGSVKSYAKSSFTGALDINRASVEAWQQLPGIGERRALAIVNYRELLGGFLSIAQVGETRALPDSVFRQIEPFLTLEYRDIRKLNLNTASVEDFDKHPYISKKQAEMLVRYREQHGGYRQTGDLKQVIAIADPQWLRKIDPYVDVK